MSMIGHGTTSGSTRAAEFADRGQGRPGGRTGRGRQGSDRQTEHPVLSSERGRQAAGLPGWGWRSAGRPGDRWNIRAGVGKGPDRWSVRPMKPSSDKRSCCGTGNSGGRSLRSPRSPSAVRGRRLRGRDADPSGRGAPPGLPEDQRPGQVWAVKGKCASSLLKGCGAGGFEARPPGG